MCLFILFFGVVPSLIGIFGASSFYRVITAFANCFYQLFDLGDADTIDIVDVAEISMSRPTVTVGIGRW